MCGSTLGNGMSDPAGQQFLVAGSRPWNRETFERELAPQAGDWAFVSTPDGLGDALLRISPRYIFFLHWSWIVPAEILDENECVLFHMTPVPFGRGGSPLQNLVTRGWTRTTLTAMRMTQDLDGGPVYLTEELDLGGTAESIYLRADALATEMIKRIVESSPVVTPQVGDVVTFERRTPSESEMPLDVSDLDRVHDHIRMLDAEGYPHAFLDHGPLRLTFRRAARYDGRVVADVTITLREPS